MHNVGERKKQASGIKNRGEREFHWEEEGLGRGGDTLEERSIVLNVHSVDCNDEIKEGQQASAVGGRVFNDTGHLVALWRGDNGHSRTLNRVEASRIPEWSVDAAQQTG